MKEIDPLQLLEIRTQQLRKATEQRRNLRAFVRENGEKTFRVTDNEGNMFTQTFGYDTLKGLTTSIASMRADVRRIIRSGSVHEFYDGGDDK